MNTRKERAEKLRNAVIFFISNDKTVKLTKLMKLLYYLDFLHYKETGQSVTGQEYTAWPKGPVPTDVWHELRLKQDRGCGLKEVVAALPVDEKADAFGFDLKPVKGAKFSERLFTKRELRIMKELAEIFKGTPAWLVVDATHQRGTPWETTVKTKGEKALLDYDLALQGLAKEELERIREEQRDRQRLSDLLGVEI